MPSLRARMMFPLLRAYGRLGFKGSYPVGYLRFLFDRLLPFLFPMRRGIACQRFAIGEIPAAWFMPPQAGSESALLYLHGGGYVIGCIRTYRRMCAELASSANCRVLAVEYRLGPEHRFPAAVEDAAAAYRWLLDQGYDPGKIIVGGDSAGGGLTLATLIYTRDQGYPLPAAGIALSPWTDLACTGDSVRCNSRQDPLLAGQDLQVWAGRYLGSADPRTPLASPIYADLQGLPPLLIQVGSREVLLDDARRLADSAMRAGVQVELEEWEGMWHVWQLFSLIVPESGSAIDKLGRFCREKMAG